jgi:hypothetical protein
LKNQECFDLALQFLFNKRKPDWVRPLHILLTANIILLCDETMVCQPSQGVLAAFCGIKKIENVANALNELQDHGWICVTSRKNRYGTNLYYPQLHNIPFGNPQTIITDIAKRLARRYFEIVKLLPKTLGKNGRWYGVRIEKGWPQHWSYLMQSWLDLGWSEEHINKVIDYAFSNLPDTAKHGPQTLKRKFSTYAKAAGITDSIPEMDAVMEEEVPALA